MTSRLQPPARPVRFLARLVFMALAVMAFLSPTGCRPTDSDRAPWSDSWTWPFAPTAPGRNSLPRVLDLSVPAERDLWYPGSAAEVAKGASASLVVKGSTPGLHVSRRIEIAAGFLGRVTLETARPMRALLVTPYLDGRARPDYAVRAEIDPERPSIQHAHFYAGRWDRHPVDGLRIEATDSSNEIALRRVEVSSQKWDPITTEDVGGTDWNAAFAEDAEIEHVVLIIADTLRSDRMSIYGYERETTPHLARLVEHGLLFDEARSQAACTFPSVNSMLTSQPTARFLKKPAKRWASLEGARPIAERLRDVGFETYAVSASSVVRATESVHNNWGGGYGAGFDHFDESCAGLSADCVNRRGIDLIDGAKGPFFLYLHFLDPHDPYRPPPANHESAFVRPYEGRIEFREGDPNPIARAIYKQGITPDVSARDLEHLRDLYDEEVLFLDRQIGTLFRALSDRSLLSKTLVVLASDHGEEFLEHGHMKHCRTVYETEVRTPLVFWIPGTKGGTRLKAPAQNLDLVPTVLDYLPIASHHALDREGMAGRSLRPAIESGTHVNTHTFSAQAGRVAVTEGRWKLITGSDSERGELYDLSSDPGERDEIAEKHPGVVERLRGVLRSRAKRGASSTEEPLEDERRTEENLRALGYLE